MGSAILDAVRTIRIAIQERGFANAKPSMLQEHNRQDNYPLASKDRYTDEYVGEVQSGLRSCKVREPLLNTVKSRHASLT